MSCWEYEKGKIKLPANQFKEFRDSIYNHYNTELKYCHRIALKVWEILKEEKKGKRNFKLKVRASELIEKHLNAPYRHHDPMSHWKFLIEYSLVGNDGKKLSKPKKKDFAPKSASKADRLNDSHLQIRFLNKEKEIIYTTEDNNDSATIAEESRLGKFVLEKLKRVKFTSKTGGYFKYQSELGEDEDGFNRPRISRTYGKYTNPKYLKQVA